MLDGWVEIFRVTPPFQLALWSLLPFAAGAILGRHKERREQERREREFHEAQARMVSMEMNPKP
jgi:hypothetical protein